MRCAWPGDDPLMLEYHDEEWGVPAHDDRLLFEHLILDGAQAGLSWRTILYKREGYHKAFDNFDARKMAAYDERKVEALLQDTGIVRNQQKIRAAIANAQAFLEVQAEFGSFDAYLWQFVGGRPIQNAWQTMDQIPATSPESEAMSKDLKKRGFKFVGPTICYAVMQAAGLVHDHTLDCFRHAEIAQLAPDAS